MAQSKGIIEYGFKEVIHEWDRMCDTIEVCSICPINKIDKNVCSCVSVRKEYCFENNNVYDKVYEAIIQWAKANPESKYPTVKELLEKLEIRMINNYNGSVDLIAPITLNINKPIHANIAEEIGLKPKEVITMSRIDIRFKKMICDKCGRVFFLNVDFCVTSLDKDGKSNKIIYCPYCDCMMFKSEEDCKE